MWHSWLKTLKNIRIEKKAFRIRRSLLKEETELEWRRIGFHCFQTLYVWKTAVAIQIKGPEKLNQSAENTEEHYRIASKRPLLQQASNAVSVGTNYLAQLTQNGKNLGVERRRHKDQSEGHRSRKKANWTSQSSFLVRQAQNRIPLFSTILHLKNPSLCQHYTD
jgi:hypothetical protein